MVSSCKVTFLECLTFCLVEELRSEGTASKDCVISLGGGSMASRSGSRGTILLSANKGFLAPTVSTTALPKFLIAALGWLGWIRMAADERFRGSAPKRLACMRSRKALAEAERATAETLR